MGRAQVEPVHCLTEQDYPNHKGLQQEREQGITHVPQSCSETSSRSELVRWHCEADLHQRSFIAGQFFAA